MNELITQAKSDLEIRMYKNISDAIQARILFKTRIFEYNMDNEKDKNIFDNTMRLLKIEIMNHLEYACIMYLNGKVNNNTFESFYSDIVKVWAKNIKSTRTNKKDKTVYSAIRQVNKLWKKEGRYATGI